MLKKAYIFSTLILLSLLLGFCKEEKKVVAWVDGSAITVTEMNYWMLLKKAEVHRHFFLQYGINDSDDFWSSTYGDESPLDMLKTLAFQAAKRCKVEQLLAFEKGIVTDVNFDIIISKLDEENQERAAKVERGEVIYGPKQYTMRTYFSYQQDKMVYDLKQKLVEEELKPTREELKALRPSPDTSIDDYSGFLSMQYVDENYDAFIDDRANVVTVKKNIKIWNSITL